MNLHEYQAKALFKAYGMPVPNNLVASTPEEARTAAENFSAGQVVVKAQVHARGRGKAGGIKIVDTPREAEDYAKSMLGTHFVTAQTDKNGQPVNAILVEEICKIENELYLGMVAEHASGPVVIKVSTEGGMQIEQILRDSPEKIHKLHIDPSLGVLPDQYHDLSTRLGLAGEQIEQFTQLLDGLYRLFVEKDLAVAEINPLVVTVDGDLVCLDGKISVNVDRLHRHPDMQALRDTTQEARGE